MSPSNQEILDTVDRIATTLISEHAGGVDSKAIFPSDALAALGQAGLLGLICAPEVGGLGLGHRAAVEVIERIARECGSTAMVTTMHYCGAAVIEKYGSEAIRKDVAAGRHVSTLAFSEVGSRSHFWAPISTATSDADGVRLDAKKGWVTSAGHAHSYVWSSKAMDGKDGSTMWLVPVDAKGLSIDGTFDGLGLRGNASAPMTADGLRLPESARLGADGEGFGIMMETVLPYFNLMSAAVSLGFMESATARTIAHASGTRHAHLGSSLADLPTIRAKIARMRILTDMSRSLLFDGLTALETGRADTMLRVLESKAACAESALEVTQLGMRICAGAAYRRDVGVERIFRDAQAASIMAPTTDVLYDFIGKAVTGLPLF